MPQLSTQRSTKETHRFKRYLVLETDAFWVVLLTLSSMLLLATAPSCLCLGLRLRGGLMFTREPFEWPGVPQILLRTAVTSTAHLAMSAW